jgi:hypothetical protein
VIVDGRDPAANLTYRCGAIPSDTVALLLENAARLSNDCWLSRQSTKS